MKNMMMALALVACGAMQASAQQSQSFGQSQANAIRGANSVNAFSSNRLRTSIYSSSVPRYNYSNVNVNRDPFKGVMGGAAPARSKPFSQVQRGPSSSPYMGLMADNPFTSTTTNYFNNVRPKLEQQKQNDQLMAQNIKMQQQLQQMATRPPYDPTGDDKRAPTGHSAVFQQHGGMYGNPGGYYPQVPIRSVRGQR